MACGHVVDFVPNHMGIGTGTERVVERRARERAELTRRRLLRHRMGARLKAELRAKLLLPILGDQYGRVLERGELQVVIP